MLKNNNTAVLSRMARRSLKYYRYRSAAMTAGVMLSAFMLFTILTLGAAYFKMEQLYHIRLYGSDSDAILYGATDEQIKLCESSPDIRYSGLCALSGYVESTPKDQTVECALLWADDTYWNKMCAPAHERIEGAYPKADDEIMASKSALKECGYEFLQTGDSLPMTCVTPNGTITRHFRISGLWEGYGHQKELFVSRSFYDQSGYELSDPASGRYEIDFEKNWISRRKQQEFTDSLQLGRQQSLIFDLRFQQSAAVFTGIAALALAICLCAYLLICNIMYLSVSGSVRRFGLLQTIGMTKKQIHTLLGHQMFIIGTAGTAGGIFFGWAVSFFLIPSAVKAVGRYTDQIGSIPVSFHPAVFLLTVALTALTLFSALRKPAKTAGAISPLEALGYRPIKTSRKRSRRAAFGSFSFRCAFRQLQKDRRKTAVIMLSSAASLSVFLCTAALTETRLYADASIDMGCDLIIRNDTLKKEDMQMHAQPMDPQLLSAIQNIPGVKEIHTDVCADIIVPWEPETADHWMQEHYELWMEESYETGRETYKKHPENFPSALVGIDETAFDDLNETLENPSGKDAFLRGETCIILRSMHSLSDYDVIGEQITCAQYADPKQTASFTIAAVTDDVSHAAMPAAAPVLLVSKTAVEKFDKTPYISMLGIYYKTSGDRQTESEILNLLADSGHQTDLSYESEIENADLLQKAQGSAAGAGIGIVLILALIWLLNYINTSVGNIQDRQAEFAALESIGMTKKQFRRMLCLEGFLYAAGSWFLTLTAGYGITCILHRLMDAPGTRLIIPVLPAAGAAALIGVLCVIIPPAACEIFSRRETLAERLKK